MNIQDHYWGIGGDTTRVYSSKLGDYVDASDPRYQGWLDQLDNRTGVWGNSEFDLGVYLGPFCVTRPVPADILAGFKHGQALKFEPDHYITKVLLYITNEVRANRAPPEPPITFEEWITRVEEEM